MPIEGAITARCFRLAFGVGLATFIAYAAALPLGYLLIIVTLALLSVPVPPPPPKAALVLVVATTLMAGVGMLLGPVLVYAPVAGVLIALSGVALAVVVGARPGMMIIGTLMILSSTIIAVIAAQSSAAAVVIVKTLVGAMIAAVSIAHLAHALFPEPVATAALPPPVPDRLGWLALRTAVIMLPPLLLALANPAAYIMLLMKGASLAQQASVGSTRRMAREMVGATAIGGVAALLLWNLLQLWPGLLLLTLGIALFALVMARPMYGATPSRLPADLWQFAMTTMIILIGPAVADTASADNIQRTMLVRLATFLALALYAAAAVHLLEPGAARQRRHPA